MFKKLPVLLMFVLLSGIAVNSKSQTLDSPDELLIAGKMAMWKEKNYPKAVHILRKAYLLSPAYTDVKILLGRAYQLNNNLDSCRYFFKEARLEQPGNPDLLNYLVGLEYGAGNTDGAIAFIDSGLTYQPKAEDLLLKKASILYEVKKYHEAQFVLSQLAAVNPKNENALRLKNQISMAAASNKVSVYYDYSQFDKFFDPWQSLSVAYQRSTSIGSIIGRVNYANRSNGLSGYQYELETYPLFSRSLYGNFAFAVNSGDPVFPKFTAQGSLFKTLGSFELQGGLRYVNTTEQSFLIYNAGVSQYVSRFLLNFKTYISDFNGKSGQGFQLSSRYFYRENADDVFVLGIGTGVAPDLSNRNLGIANISNLSGRRIFSEYRRVVGAKNILSLFANLAFEEYSPNRSANQYNLGFGYQRKF